jgi:hypothetical protein
MPFITARSAWSTCEAIADRRAVSDDVELDRSNDNNDNGRPAGRVSARPPMMALHARRGWPGAEIQMGRRATSIPRLLYGAGLIFVNFVAAVHTASPAHAPGGI